MISVNKADFYISVLIPGILLYGTGACHHAGYVSMAAAFAALAVFSTWYLGTQDWVEENLNESTDEGGSE